MHRFGSISVRTAVGVVAALLAAALPQLASASTAHAAAPGAALADRASTAAAAVGCFGNNCSGLDPNVEGCSADAQTIDEFTDGARIELRVSNACDAACVRATSSRHSNADFATVQGWDKRSGGSLLEHQDTGIGPGTTWSNMVSFFDWVSVCIGLIGTTPTECTARH